MEANPLCKRVSDPQTDVAPGSTRGRNVRSKNQCSMCPAIHTKSRSWLRSSSTREPSDPLLRVVIFVFRDFSLKDNIAFDYPPPLSGEKTGEESVSASPTRRLPLGQNGVSEAPCRGLGNYRGGGTHTRSPSSSLAPPRKWKYPPLTASTRRGLRHPIDSRNAFERSPGTRTGKPAAASGLETASRGF